MFVRVNDVVEIISGDDKGGIHVQVRIKGAVGEAQGTSMPGAVAYAVARAVGIEA